ncbi:MAG: alpha/beta fold hydrolase [Candidatus Pacebacteria bacterium]|nr:alpha/beta fold hydrolase [Candidatus Paceibacterota bacterium]
MIKTIIVGVTFFLVFISFASLWGFASSIRPPKIISANTPKDLGLEYEDITFTTGDGIDLSGWFIPSKNTEAKTIILLHGYPADKGDILPALAFLNERFNLFLFDFRYFGKSHGAYSTVGARETEDLAAAVRYLKARGINEVGVWGFSMGGAVALMAAPQVPAIKAIVSEASYARMDLMSRELYRIPVLKYPLAELTRLWGRLFIGIDLKKISPEKSVRSFQIPVLVIHSVNDNVIPFEHALLLKDALKDNPRAEFWLQEGLVHGQFDKTYQIRVEEFFQKNL